jgi:zinc protease
MACAVVLSCTPTQPKFAFKTGERRGKLESNGLKFIIMPDATTQMVEVDVRYDVGARSDPDGKAGLAHFVEHLMFQQRPDGPTTPPLFQWIADLDIGFNAGTDWDTTHYNQYGRAENVDAMLKIDAMRLFYGCQTISNEQFLREREVVRNEIRQRGGGVDGQVLQLVLGSIYPPGHAYSRPVGGDDKNLTNITLDDACKFMKDYYTPENATVVVAGGVDIDKTIASIQKWFGKLEKRATAPRTKVEQFAITPGTKTFELDLERPAVVVAWALPPANTPEGEAADFGIWSAYFRTARKGEEYGFATSVEPILLGGQLAPVFAIKIDLKGMGKLDEALEFVRKGARQAHRGFDEGTWEDVELQRNLRKADFISRMETLQARTYTIANLVQFSRDIDFDSQDVYIKHELDKIGKFDGAQVGRAVKKALDFDRARIVVLKSNKEGIKGDTRAAFTFHTKSEDEMSSADVDPSEARKPIKVAAELKALEGAQRFELGNGMKVILMPVHAAAIPVAAASLIFHNTGDARTPNDPALAATAADMLSLPRDAEAFARTGVSVSCRTSSDDTVCRTSGIRIYLDVMMKGLERLVTAGEYSQEEIERWQKRVKLAFESQRAQQETEFGRQILTAVYGPDHPYTKTGLLTPAAAAKIHYDSLNNYRRSHYTAGNATLIVAGDFDPKQAESLIRSNFGGWSRGTVDKPVDPAPYRRTGPAMIGVVGKELPQLRVAISYPAPAGVDGQEGARRVLTEMMNIRMGDIRFKLGSTYGTYADREPQRGPTAYEMGGTVDAERAGESIRAMRDGINMLRKGDHFDEDFVRARRKIISNLLGESTVTAELVGRLGFIDRYGLPTTYYNTLLQQVAAVSTAQIKALIASELDPNNEVVVVLGDKKHLDKAFVDAGIKDVKIVEPEYK